MQSKTKDGFPRWLRGKESAGKAGDAGDMSMLPRLADPREKGMATHSTPVFLLRNPMERGAWPAPVHRAAKSQMQLSAHSKMKSN